MDILLPGAGLFDIGRIFLQCMRIVWYTEFAEELSFKGTLLIGQRTAHATAANHSLDFRE